LLGENDGSEWERTKREEMRRMWRRERNEKSAGNALAMKTKVERAKMSATDGEKRRRE